MSAGARVARAGLCRTKDSYRGLEPPYGPGKSYPELQSLLPPDAVGDAPNPVYAAVRAALRGAGLDEARFGRPDWNPIGDLVARGGRVVLKPNFIRHYNPSPAGTVESVITHGSILRAIADYAFLAVGEGGEVEIAEAPQMDCDFEEIRRISGLHELARFYDERLRRKLGIIDLRREAVVFDDGIIVERTPLPGDPRGYREVDLGRVSFFEGSGLDPDRLRGADYDPGPTGDQHRAGRNAYLLSETVLSADLVINLPKLKTHKKTGVTLALKNLVGINGDKNWLPHHSLGSVRDGGDEFPDDRIVDRVRSFATELARPLLARGIGTRLFRVYRKVETSARGDEFIRSGNWYGNRTTWRMCLDLNRCLYYSDSNGLHLDARAPVRTVLTVLDGIVAGEGAGPLAPNDKPLGVIIASVDPLAVDLVAVRLMGFDEQKLPKLREAMSDRGPRVTSVRGLADVGVQEVSASDFVGHPVALEQMASDSPFMPHMGWKGHIERVSP